MILELFSPDIDRQTVELSPPTAWKKWLRNLKDDRIDDDDLTSWPGGPKLAHCGVLKSADEPDWSLPVVAFDVTKFDRDTQQEVANWLFYWTDPFAWSAVALRDEGDGFLTQVRPAPMNTNPWFTDHAHDDNKERLSRFLGRSR